jgi:glucosylceramidase
MAANVDWNLIVNLKTGGPFHNTNAGESSSAAVFVDADKKEFILGPLYYTNGHFSKFIKRDAFRIGSSSYSDAIKVAAFNNPNGEIIVVVLNTTETDARPKIRLNDCTATLRMPAKSLQTLIIPNN